MSRREVSKKVEKVFLDALIRFGETLPFPDLSDTTISEAKAYELFEPLVPRINEFLRGYKARCEGDLRNAVESVDWLAGWDMCKADLPTLKVFSVAQRNSVKQMVRLFKLSRPGTQGLAR